MKVSGKKPPEPQTPGGGGVRGRRVLLQWIPLLTLTFTLRLWIFLLTLAVTSSSGANEPTPSSKGENEEGRKEERMKKANTAAEDLAPCKRARDARDFYIG